MKPIASCTFLTIALATTMCGRPTNAAWPAPIRADYEGRDVRIHWPADAAPETADTFASNAIDVAAPCAKVWPLLVGAPRWPSWYPNAKDVRIDREADALTPGAVFHWTTFGLPVTSRVYELEAPARLGWYGETNGLVAYHTWLLVDAPGGCHVVTEETGRGPAALDLRAKHPSAIHEGHAVWLDRLAREATR